MQTTSHCIAKAFYESYAVRPSIVDSPGANRGEYAMNLLAKCILVGLAIGPAVPATVFAQSAQAIYKFTDESGRVTYANSPIKGGTKLNLEPLTIMQTAVPPINTAPSARTIPVAKVTSVSSPSYPINVPPAKAVAVMPTATAPEAAASLPAPISIPAAVPKTVLAVLDATDKAQEIAQQRRADVRRRILENEIQAEEKSLGATRLALAEEQRRTGEIRAMRATFAAAAVAATTQKPLISPDTRAEIERHFERVRNLQDEVAMHEGNIVALREEMLAKKS